MKPGQCPVVLEIDLSVGFKSRGLDEDSSKAFRRKGISTANLE
jgi:hypothetical protein